MRLWVWVYACDLGEIKMLDLFAILTKGGLVLWCLEGTPFSTTLASVNALIKDVILQVRVSQWAR